MILKKLAPGIEKDDFEKFGTRSRGIGRVFLKPEKKLYMLEKFLPHHFSTFWLKKTILDAHKEARKKTGGWYLAY